MITNNQITPIDKKDRDEILDFGIRIGQACWDVYCRSNTGFSRVFMLPNGDARRRANELFHLGFNARLFMCPPGNNLDTATETSDGETMWQDYLGTMDGKIVLGFVAHPETPEFILGYAKEFFLEGFRAGTITAREIFKR